MDEPLSPGERRRRAPLHFLAKADNARMAARYLWDATEATMHATADNIGYGGSTITAASEAFERESSLAIELIIKALIAQQIQNGVAAQHVTHVRATHDVVSLWHDAGLPKLDKFAQLHLLQAKQALYWSGRYAAPRTDDQWEKDLNDLDKLLPVVGELGCLTIKSTQPPEWDTFDRIYGTASDGFWALRKKFEPA